MKRLLPLAALLIVLPALATAQTAAPVPAFLNFQGRLAKPDGTPIPDNAAQSLTFSLYDAPTGGNLLWSQTSGSVAVRNGAFAAKLNFGVGFASGNTFVGTFANPLTTPYLQIQVGKDAPLLPRQPFASSAYSFVASTALSVPAGSLTAASFAGGVLTPSGAAGGDLTGAYPNPSLLTDVRLLPKVSGGMMSVGQEAIPSVDQSQLSVGYFMPDMNSTWQSFTPSQTQAITGLDIYVGNSASAPSTMTLALYAGEGVGGTLLYSAPFNYAGGFGPQHFDLTGIPPVLQGNARYTFQITETGGQSMRLIYQYGNLYSAGDCSVLPGVDLYFQTYARLANVVTLRGNLNINGGSTLFSNGVDTLLTGTGGGIPLEVIGSNSFPQFKVAATASAPYGAFLSLDATQTTGGKEWLLYSTGGAAGEGQGKFVVQNVTNPVFPLAILPTGQVGINTTSPNAAYALDVNGAAHASSLAAGSATITGDVSAASATIPALNGMVTVTSTGRIAVATVSPNVAGTWVQLSNTSAGGHIWNVISSGSGNSEGVGKLLFNDQSSSVTRMLIDASGHVGIGTNTPAYALDVNGQVRASNVSVTSDARFKMDVRTLDSALENVLQLRGVSYDWDRAKWPAKNFPEGRQVGFIAQEVERIFPELVLTDADGYKSVAYANVVPALVEAVKTLNTKLDDKQKQIDELKVSNAELKAQMKEIDAIKKQNAHISELEKQLAAVLEARKLKQDAPR